MPKVSAGLLMFREREGTLEVLLAHPGGPYFRNRDEGSWTIPKGIVERGEEPLDAARREFEEETGFTPCEPYVPLGSIQQKGGKIVQAWGFEGDCDPGALRSNTFEVEWPPRSGQVQEYPEIDRAEFFTVPAARIKINPAQCALIDRLEEHRRAGSP
jgi:predicted NUDIX family NTP pyrophosphohydrolase